MLSKLVVLVLIAGAVWFLVLRPLLAPFRRRPGRPAPRQTARPVALVACPDCGVYRDPRLPCTCRPPE